METKASKIMEQDSPEYANFPSTRSMAKDKTSRQKDSTELVLTCAKAAIDKKAENTIIYDVSKLGAFTDYFLLTSGTNERQTQAIADEIVKMAKEAGLGRGIIEGYDEGRWVLVDFGSVVIHVFHHVIREFYNLEELWGHAPKLSIPQEFYTSSQGVGLNRLN